jgi:aspartyl aminopeptidase
MQTSGWSSARTLCADLDASPTPYHAVTRAIEHLDAAGFHEATETWETQNPAGRWYFRDGGALVAWVVSADHHASSPFRVVGAHTDSPNLRIKPVPDLESAGLSQLGVEVYGGALTNSWLDRDLGLAGRVVAVEAGEPRTFLFRDNRPILRVPQLAIHLDEDFRRSGLNLNRQRHLVPVWSTGSAPTFTQYLADQLSLDPEAVLSWDAMAFDLTPATLAGLNEEFLVSARIDNQLSCFVALRSLVQVADEPGPSIPVVALFDHEEVGSVSTTGAASPFLRRQLERIWRVLGASAADVYQSCAKSLVVSADGAHATHPNYPERHDPEHTVELNGGPVLKVNANQRYATDATTAARFELACRRAEVPMQRFVSRGDVACGSTIGPAAAGELGIAVVDAGIAQLAMHSAREMAGADDPQRFADVLRVLLGQ